MPSSNLRRREAKVLPTMALGDADLRKGDGAEEEDEFLQELGWTSAFRPDALPPASAILVSIYFFFPRLLRPSFAFLFMPATVSCISHTTEAQ